MLLSADGDSERAIGEWLQRRSKAEPAFRSKVVLISKYAWPVGAAPHDKGASREHIMQQIELSLLRLQTSYIDLYMQHVWDHSTPIEETLLALNELIRQGKIRYLGAANFTAVQLYKANQFARQHGLSGFAVVEDQYNLLDRSVECDVADTCVELGVALMPWSPLAGGWLSGKFASKKDGAHLKSGVDSKVLWANATPAAAVWRAETHDNDTTWRTIEVLHRLASKHSVHPSAIAIAWLLHRPAVRCVVVGPRTVEQLNGNLQASAVELTKEEMTELSEVSKKPQPMMYELVAAVMGRVIGE